MSNYEIELLIVGVIMGAISSALILLAHSEKQRRKLVAARNTAAFLDGVLTQLHKKIGHHPWFKFPYEQAIKKMETKFNLAANKKTDE